MNVVFRLPSEELEKKFVERGGQAGAWSGSPGTARPAASAPRLYNAVPLESVETLVTFMKDFAKRG